MPERSVEEDRAWRVDAGGDRARRGQTDRREPCGLEVAGDQSDRLMADRSNRNQEHDVRLLGATLFDDQSGGLGLHPPN